ncbi:hypothetical protein PAHAL_5G287300 [Panicum hallii]|uniref:Uncharacterized protein n=1 Tax=Panicum hallii TaxID=206008 RepID=A0A2T8ILK9_9POAL|nr:hypothetical protein PAHAL_5G287300 [Panicum hallii]
MPSFPSMGTTTELAATACHRPARCRSLRESSQLPPAGLPSLPARGACRRRLAAEITARARPRVPAPPPVPCSHCSHSRRWSCRALLLTPLLRHERLPPRPRPHGPAGCSSSLLRRARSSSPCVPPFYTSKQHFGRKVLVAGTSQTRRTGERTDEDRREKTTGRKTHIDRAVWLDLMWTYTNRYCIVCAVVSIVSFSLMW